MSEHYLQQMKCARLCMAVNFLLAVIKITTGVVGYSKAMLADGVHSLFDLTADIFVMVSIHVANRPSDGMHPYGYKRYETLGNIVISIVLMVLAVGIAFDALYGQSLQQILNWKLVLPMAALAVIVNELAYRYVMYHATMLSSDILKSLAVHQRSDAATSSVVLISVLSFLLGLGASDQIAALIISAMILYYALPATLKSIAELLDRGLGKDEVQKIEAVIADVEGVLDFHLLRSRQMASKGLLDVHIVVDSMISVSEGHYIGDLVEYQIKKKCKVEDVTVHVDFYDDHQHQTVALPSRAMVYDFLKEIQVPSHLLTSKCCIIHYGFEDIHLELKASKDDLSVLQQLPWQQKPVWLKDVEFYERIES